MDDVKTLYKAGEGKIGTDEKKVPFLSSCLLDLESIITFSS